MTLAPHLFHKLADRLGRPASRLLLAFEPERAHALSLRLLESGMPAACPPHGLEGLKVRAADLEWPNPLGLAAGYDKDGRVANAVLRLGFGFVEVGTVTPRPQAGNPRPRLFRLPEDRAVINRLGFNNAGHDAVYRRLATRIRRSGIVGVNVGANRDSTDRVADYVLGIERFADVADYLTVNISSPNTPGLRNLQERTNLALLLDRLAEARTRAAVKSPPLFVKIAPDLGEREMDDIAAEVLRTGMDGVIVANTTISRVGLVNRPEAQEAGGLSGPPLFRRATAVLAHMRKRLGPELALIGVGGVDSPATALEKIRAGADLVQLYTGLIYEGPGLPGRILCGLAEAVKTSGAPGLKALRDTRLEVWSREPL
jgi:dihydroorotate dehydrogenase